MPACSGCQVLGRVGWREAAALAVAVMLGALALAAPALAAHPIPESQRWATVTHAGNEAYEFSNTAGNRYSYGRVDYEYQISRTEITHGEWLEFVNAYAPYQDPNYGGGSGFTSYWIQPYEGGYRVHPGMVNRPARVNWYSAARYCNWLHNGKRPEREAFEQGVYDASTFNTFNPDGSRADDFTAAPGAQYWIPTHDEWVKAAHFDPNKFGPNQPGYWTYPTTSDTFPMPGTPESGAQTSNGYFGSQLNAPEVAAYRNVMSPWGLWDVSGGAIEWVELMRIHTEGGALFPLGLEGSSSDLTHPKTAEDQDRLDRWNNWLPSGSGGIRLARAVPNAPGVGVFFCVMIASARRKR